jgi:hypothetical protein
MGQSCRSALAVVASVFGAALAAQGCGGGGGGGMAPPPATTATVSFATRSSVVASESGAVTIEVVLTLPPTQWRGRRRAIGHRSERPHAAAHLPRAVVGRHARRAGQRGDGRPRP